MLQRLQSRADEADAARDVMLGHILELKQDASEQQQARASLSGMGREIASELKCLRSEIEEIGMEHTAPVRSCSPPTQLCRAQRAAKKRTRGGCGSTVISCSVSQECKRSM